MPVDIGFVNRSKLTIMITIYDETVFFHDRLNQAQARSDVCIRGFDEIPVECEGKEKNDRQVDFMKVQ